jgi:hypothetical protein
MGAPGFTTMPRKKRNDITVKIDAKIHSKAKKIAAWRDVDLAEYLSELLEKPVERDWQRLRREVAGEPDASSA